MKLYSISEVAEILGMPRLRLQYYRNQGYVWLESKHMQGVKPFYTEEDIDIIRSKLKELKSRNHIYRTKVASYAYRKKRAVNAKVE